MSAKLTGIFNPYAEFNIEVEPATYCSHCGWELKNNFILGKDRLITESAVFCSPNCRDSYEADHIF